MLKIHVELTKVFVSSVIEELRNERGAVKEVVESFDFLKAWVFENAPASSEQLDESFLRHVEECDMFILILGTGMTDPVIAEFLKAKELGKRILVFVKKAAGRAPSAQMLLGQVDVKYAEFDSIEDLKTHVKSALTETITLGLRTSRTAGHERSVFQQLAKLSETKAIVHLTPIYPLDASQDEFQIANVNPETMTLQKVSLGQSVFVPVSRVKEILVRGGGARNKLVLSGRMQLVTLQRIWSFFDEKPPVNSQYGFEKHSNPSDPRVAKLTSTHGGRFDFYWGAVDELPSYESKGVDSSI